MRIVINGIEKSQYIVSDEARYFIPHYTLEIEESYRGRNRIIRERREDFSTSIPMLYKLSKGESVLNAISKISHDFYDEDLATIKFTGTDFNIKGYISYDISVPSVVNGFLEFNINVDVY